MSTRRYCVVLSSLVLIATTSMTVRGQSPSWQLIAPGVNYADADGALGEDVFVGMGGYTATQEMVDSGQVATAQVREVQKTEVVLIGGIHFNHLLHPDNSPAHLRALLKRLEPDVIALENPPEWQEEARHYWTYLPEYYVGELFAKENGLPVEGIDWQGPLDARRVAWIRSIPTRSGVCAIAR